MGKADTESATRNNKIICLPFPQEDYNANDDDPIKFRKCIDDRIEQSFGRNSIVGTTIGNPDDIPQHLGADEKHTQILVSKSQDLCF